MKSMICATAIYALCGASVDYDLLSNVNYPERGTWWTVNGRYPDAIVMRTHLSTGEHAGKFSADRLQAMKRDELHALHSDDHEGRHVLIFTSQNCGPCARWKTNELPKLRTTFTTSTSPDHGQMRLLDYAKHSRLARQLGVRTVPSFVFVRQNRRLRYSGFMSATQFVQNWKRP